jgi:DNA-binding transcriptional ArsR family regulator
VAAADGDPAEAAAPRAAAPGAASAKTASAEPAQAKAPGVFAALGEPVRRRILELLADGEQPVGPLVVALRSRAPISQPAVSQHLRVLLDAGLVSVRAAGTRRLYALDTAGLDAARAWLDRLADPLAPFAQPLDALATEIARGRRATRADGSGQAGGSGRATQVDRPA